MLVYAGETVRKAFVEGMARKSSGLYTVDRAMIFESVVEVFKKDGVEDEFPLRVMFKGERGIDVGGVYRDMLSAFWKDAFVKMFDGGCLLSPVVHPDTDLSILPVIGKIVSHGYLSSSFLPVKMAFPGLASLLLQTNEVSEEILLTTFTNMVSVVEAVTLSQAFTEVEFSEDLQMRIASILGRFGCRQLPTAKNVRQLVIQVARFEFITKPMATLQAMSAGIPLSHREFWRKVSVQQLYDIYLASAASPGKVLQLLNRVESQDENEQRVFRYLTLYVANMKTNEAQQFLRFVTGSSVASTEGIQVSFNNLDGVARRPIAHTCSSSLILPTAYDSYDEFKKEFRAVLSGEESWRIDGL